MNATFPPELAQKVADSGILAVVVLDSAQQAPALADALASGGITAVELALRTPQSLEALRALRRHNPSLLIGAGTVIRPEQVRMVQDAGADFAVAPGTHHRVLEAACAAGISFAPGIVTPSDIENALAYGCNILKFFPAEPAGGLAYLRNMTAPYRHLKLRYIPLGGLNGENIAPYAQDKDILAIGGSWIAPKETIAAGNWDEITRRARQAVNTVKQYR